MNDVIYKSKRKNFFELRGFLKFVDKNNNILNISDSIKYKKKSCLIIKNKSFQFLVYEAKNILIIINNINKSKNNSKKITIPFQSQLTKSIVLKIINKEPINLPSLKESFFNHKLILKTFNNHIYSLKKSKKIIIT